MGQFLLLPFRNTKQLVMNAWPKEACDTLHYTHDRSPLGTHHGGDHCAQRTTQTLECHPKGTIYTFYRSIDDTMLIGYSEDLDLISNLY